jgi:hypothetical protein
MPSASIGIANASAPDWRAALSATPHVTFVEKRTARERDRLDPAEREHHGTTIDLATFELQGALGDPIAQDLVTPADAVAPWRSVLQRIGRIDVEHVGGESFEVVEGERRRVGQPGFEGPADLQVGGKLERAPTRNALHALRHEPIQAHAQVNHLDSACCLRVPPPLRR